MSNRKKIPLKTLLASTLRALGHVPYAHAKLMSEDQIISLYQFHHNILHSTEPIDEYWNIEPLLIAEHRKRFPIDAAVAAKLKRLTGQTGNGPKHKINSRTEWPKGRKLQGRGFERRA